MALLFNPRRGENMKTIQTSKLDGIALNYAVAMAEGGTEFIFDGFTWGFKLGGKTKVMAKGWGLLMQFCPAADWSTGGPIIERERIDVISIANGTGWKAETPRDHGDQSESGPTPLIAAMRCFVASKLGDMVEIPEGVKP